MTQAYNFGVETQLGGDTSTFVLLSAAIAPVLSSAFAASTALTHLGGGDTSAFVVQSTAIARAPSSNFIASTALTKGAQRF